jgi:hypothetical protein
LEIREFIVMVVKSFSFTSREIILNIPVNHFLLDPFRTQLISFGLLAAILTPNYGIIPEVGAVVKIKQSRMMKNAPEAEFYRAYYLSNVGED